jgi:hypothetical protein
MSKEAACDSTGHGSFIHEGAQVHFLQDGDKMICSQGGKHDWSDETRLDAYGGVGVFCRKCNMDYGEMVMWM